MTYVQPIHHKTGKPAGPEQKPEPIIEEKFLVTVKSPTCKCTVTVTGDIDGLRKVIPIHKCNGRHDAMMNELAAAGIKQMDRLIGDIRSEREPV